MAHGLRMIMFEHFQDLVVELLDARLGPPLPFIGPAI
jgi:hypothetical protein